MDRRRRTILDDGNGRNRRDPQPVVRTRFQPAALLGDLRSKLFRPPAPLFTGSLRLVGQRAPLRGGNARLWLFLGHHLIICVDRPLGPVLLTSAGVEPHDSLGRAGFRVRAGQPRHGGNVVAFQIEARANVQATGGRNQPGGRRLRDRRSWRLRGRRERGRAVLHPPPAKCPQCGQQPNRQKPSVPRRGFHKEIHQQSMCPAAASRSLPRRVVTDRSPAVPTVLPRSWDQCRQVVTHPVFDHELMVVAPVLSWAGRLPAIARRTSRLTRRIPKSGSCNTESDTLLLGRVLKQVFDANER